MTHPPPAAAHLESLGGLNQAHGLPSNFETQDEGVMADEPKHFLEGALNNTELQLQAALDEVCEEVEVQETPTDELIRIEETLAIACDAAKQAISLRQRIDADGGSQLS